VGEVHRSATQRYVKHCVIMPYHIKQLQGGYKYSKVKEHSLQLCITVDAVCPHRHVCDHNWAYRGLWDITIHLMPSVNNVQDCCQVGTASLKIAQQWTRYEIWISVEQYNYEADMLNKKLHKWILKIRNNEQLQQWNEGIICPVYKKGDRLNCNNYRPVTLLNIAYKIFAVLLNKRLIENIENKLEDNQMGFHPNRSTIDISLS
jgi:hypothetical protein